MFNVGVDRTLALEPPEQVDRGTQAERGPSGSPTRNNWVKRKLNKLQGPPDRFQDLNEAPP